MSDVYGYDEYNDSISEELHHSLRAGTRQSNGVLHVVDSHLFEPMSMREENWAESAVKNALRAGASKSSHAVVSPEPFAMLNFQGSKSNTVLNDGSVSFTLNAMHGHDVHVVGYEEPVEVEYTTDDQLRVFPGGHDMTGQDTNLVVRRLTPLECELLMGWDAGWTEVGITEEGQMVEMADTHRYRMCGNGVVANVAEWFGVRYAQAREAAGL